MADTTVNNIEQDIVYPTPLGTVLARRGDKVITSDPAINPVVFKSVERKIGGKTYVLALTIT